MSYTELHVGKLIKINLGGQSIKDYVESKGVAFDEDESHVYDSQTGKYLYFIINGNLYENQIITSGEDEGYLSHGLKQPNGDIDYVIQFYNGGTYEGEMIEELVERINS